MNPKAKITVDDLYHVPGSGKAEIVKGKIVRMPPTGDLPSSAGFNIALSLREHQRRTGVGRAYPDNIGFIVNLPGRVSFSPDAAFHLGSRTGGRFLEGAPIFAVEVRSEGDYGAAAEREITRKRADYFAAGTMVLWDVDVLREEVVRVYRASDPDNPTIYRRREVAEAEPAVPGWRMLVDDLFE
jgi:Uma2 family endonuclease